MSKTSKTVVKESFWDKEQVIAQVPSATGKSVTRIALVEKDGVQFVDVRKYVKGKGNPEGTFTQHTSSGISVPLGSQEELTNIIAGLMTAGELAFGKAGKQETGKTRKPRHKKNKNKKGA